MCVRRFSDRPMSYQTELLKDYYRVFGPSGVALAARAKVLGESGQRLVRPPGAVNPVAIRLRTSDIPTYREVFIQQAYRISLRQPPAVIVDAGANIGLTSVYFAIRYPSARIIAVEPEASNFALLQANTAPYANVTPVRAALWRENTGVDVIDPGKGKWGFQTVADAGRPAIQRVPGMTVDALMDRCGLQAIDVLKIDIEGAEKEVFADASAWIDRVGVLMVELHERMKTGCNRAVYAATGGFPTEWVQGPNNVGMARTGMLADA
jgi:FkbM family methyltransferase